MVLSGELTALSPFHGKIFWVTQGPWAATAEKLSALPALCVPENMSLSLIFA